MPKLCAFGCKPAENTHTHRFPNPEKHGDRFKVWVSLVGGRLEKPSDYEFYKKKIVCDRHFTNRDRNANNRLNVMAIPSLYLNGDRASIKRDLSPEFSSLEECQNTESLDIPTKSEEYVPKFHDDVASSFEQIATTGLKEETRIELINKHPIPDNCTAIHAPSITADIKAKVTKQVLKQDEAIQAKQKQLAAAISSLGRIISDQLNSNMNNTELVKQLMDTGHLLCDLQYLESLERYNNINSSKNL